MISLTTRRIFVTSGPAAGLAHSPPEDRPSRRGNNSFAADRDAVSDWGALPRA